jgi:hypothetical protein
VVPFGDDASETYEIVPAYWAHGPQARTVYNIPAPGSGWRESAPDAHLSYVSTINDRHGGKVKQLARFLKAWKYYRTVPLSSFYLEMRTASYAAGESSIVYSYDVYAVLRKLRAEDLAAMNDPMNLVGRIHAYSGYADYRDALSKLDIALARAEKALEAERNGNIRDAFRWWDAVYNDHFPAYG